MGSVWIQKVISQMENNKIVFFDGVCHLCMGSVQFLLKHNIKKNLYFATIGGKTYSRFITNENSLPDSIVYLKDNKLYLESDAVLKIAEELRFPISLLIFFRILPKFIRNLLYRFIAKHRYSWFGKAEVCMIPNPGDKERFLD
ncbi:DCC1-like thiol-disulfide oxidoreductase family protein [Leptospira sp. 96542]|nr:DCC1-like thiol-disulfide oxidoreductase family protein [Leptospira sp. 96542]